MFKALGRVGGIRRPVNNRAGSWEALKFWSANDKPVGVLGASLRWRVGGVRISVRERQPSRCVRGVIALARGSRSHFLLLVFSGCRDAGSWEAFACLSANDSPLGVPGAPCHWCVGGVHI